MGEDDWKRLYREFVESVFVPGGLPGKRCWGGRKCTTPAARRM
ncbi:MAG TPA: hypothetical protein VMM79_16210 [Longimicrobiales bacterium]|nr:hypothetical protein [Longimicrobiales bacterium]